MFAQIQGSEKELEPGGRTGRRAERITLGCLQSGVSARAQWRRSGAPMLTEPGRRWPAGPVSVMHRILDSGFGRGRHLPSFPSRGRLRPSVLCIVRRFPPGRTGSLTSTGRAGLGRNSLPAGPLPREPFHYSTDGDARPSCRPARPRGPRSGEIVACWSDHGGQASREGHGSLSSTSRHGRTLAASAEWRSGTREGSSGGRRTTP